MTRPKTIHFRKTIIIYGLLLATLIGILKFVEYRYFVRELSLEVYMGIVAALCTMLGIWIGLKVINKRELKKPFEVNQQALDELGISKREYEVLELMAQGCSNQEIADRLFVSLPTVKTHSSNLFDKLEVQRRTQAVSAAKELRLIP